jgi:predicted permease
MRWWQIKKRNADLERELQSDLELEEEEQRVNGLSPKEAHLAARRALGNLPLIREQTHESWGWAPFERLWQDVHFALRQFGKKPGFVIACVAILSLGIGANTAVFSVINAVLLKPLSYRDPDRIVTLASATTSNETTTALSKQVSIPDVKDWHDQSSSFEAMAYYSSREMAVLRNTTSEYARVSSVSPEFFRVFGVQPILGRSFTPDEMKQGSSGAAMISYAYWQSHFGGDPHVLGQVLRYPGTRPIVGVLPPAFQFPRNTDVWVSSVGPPGSRGGRNFLAVARLKDNVPLQQANAEMSDIARRLEQQYPASNKGQGVAVTRLSDAMVGNVRTMLYLLLGAVGVLLLIACANTATLLLGRAATRGKEIAVRAALGATRRRIVRQLVTESLLLALMAGVGGLVLALAGQKILVAMAPTDVPRLAETGIDRWVLAFTLGLSTLTSLLFGLLPAVYASKVNLNDALRQGRSQTAAGSHGARLRGAMVVTEIALAVTLFSSAGLLMKSFAALENVTLGFQPENVLVMRATVPGAASVSMTRTRQFFRDMLSQVATLPGVMAAGATMAPPGNVDSTGGYMVGQLPALPNWNEAPSTVFSIVAPNTFNALGIPMRAGRDFSDSDTSDSPNVAIVNETLVRRSFPGQNPVGRTIYCPFDVTVPMTIVGVVGDVRQRGPDLQPMPECYMPYLQHAFNGATLSLLVRTKGDPGTLEQTLQELAHRITPDAPMKFTTMEKLVSENVAAPKFRTLLFAVFAGLALCLAMAGVYSVIAYTVGERSNEIGLRMALGASRESIVRLMLRQGMTLVCIGLGIGLLASFAGTQLLKSLLFEVKPNDPAVYLAVTALLSAVALAAGWVPAGRAAKINPLDTLKSE